MGDVFEILKSTTASSELAGVQMGKKKGYWGNSPAIITKDAALAKDIQQKFGQDGSRDVVVARRPDKSTGKTFQITRVPWHEENA